MLKTFCGNNTVAVREAAFSYINDLQQKNLELESINEDTYQPGIFNDAAGGASLFGTEKVYVIDTPSTKKDIYADTVTNLPILSESPHQFVIIEGALLAPEKKKFQKFGELEEFKTSGSERFNTFSLTDALARKDKKSLWLLLHEARLSGIALEEIIGVLWWQLKTLRLAAMTNSADEAGMKAYPYNKAKQSLSTFKTGELESLSHSLLTLQHESRLGNQQLDISLEHWVLKI